MSIIDRKIMAFYNTRRAIADDGWLASELAGIQKPVKGVLGISNKSGRGKTMTIIEFMTVFSLVIGAFGLGFQIGRATKK